MAGPNIDFEGAVQNYWQYYLELENEFLCTGKYVSFDEGNYGTFSIEFLKLFQATCSEVEVMAKALALLADNGFEQKNANIKKWWYEIQDRYRYFANLADCHSNPNAGVSLAEAQVRFMEKIDIKPWMGLRYTISFGKKGKEGLKLTTKNNPLFWWTDHNEVKHQRMDLSNQRKSENYGKANLKNVIFSLGALYILETVLLQNLGTADELESFVNDSKLFQPRQRFITTGDLERMCDSSD